MVTDMKEHRQVLAFAREAGGAAAIAPVCEAMINKGWEVLLLGKDYSLPVFKRHGLKTINFPRFDVSLLEKLIKRKFKRMPDVIFTSAASLPFLDMTERYLWKWGQRRGIPAIGLLDQWQNYAARFSGAGKNSRLAYLPDYIFAMDRTARKGMIKEGIPSCRIRITGQPAFEAAARQYRSLRFKSSCLKKRLSIPRGYTVVTFVSEAFKKDFKGKLGYDEQSTLTFTGGVLNDLSRRTGAGIFLLVKLHPANSSGDFKWVSSAWGSIAKKVVSGELTSTQAIAVSDVVVGMSSAMLIEALLAGKPVVSLELNSSGSQLALTHCKAVPYIRAESKGEAVIGKIILDADFRKDYLNKQGRFSAVNNPRENCLNEIIGIISGGK